jgi:ferredoxin
MRPTEWDRERIAAFLAERRQATVERRAEHAATARCIGCGGALGVVRKVTKKFCSKACRVRHYDPRRGPRKRDLDRAARRAEWAKRPCDLCGRPLGPVRSTWKRFCSRDCYEKASAPKRGVLIEPRARRRA